MAADDSRICDCIAVYQQSLTHQSALSPKNTRERTKAKVGCSDRKWKYAKDQKKVKFCVKIVYVRVSPMQQADSCNQNILHPTPVR
jgi:hypothetical protein